MQTFNVKDPAESVPLTFNMSAGLVPGEVLVSTPIVSVFVSEGSDPNPTNILNGGPAFDVSLTRLIQPVFGGINGCEYQIVVTCPTSNPIKTLTLVGILPVRR